jgi:hypothetical protein
VNGDDEIEAGQNRRKTRDENPQRRRDDVAVGGGRTVGRVEGPPGIDSATERGHHREQAAEDVNVPAQQVDARKREILRPDHDRDEEVAENGWNRRDQEEEDHHHAVHGEHLVIRVGGHHVAGGGQELQPDHEGEHAANEEERGNRRQVEQRDPLMVSRQQPRREAVSVVDVVQGCHG